MYSQKHEHAGYLLNKLCLHINHFISGVVTGTSEPSLTLPSDTDPLTSEGS